MRTLLLCALLAVAPGNAWTQTGQRPYPPRIEDARVESYKSAGDVRLNIYIFEPPGHRPGDRRPAIVFFFGGGWRSGSPQQFVPQCRHLASRGLVAIAADYRVASRHDVKVVDCVRDAKSAIRWVRANANRLGVDPDRIAAGGGSAGGHLAAAAALLPEFDELGEDRRISSRPNALVLFNPALVLAPVEGFPFPRNLAELTQRMGAEPQALSPYHHIRMGAPPTIIFHGKADTTVPYRTVELFTQRMREAGNRCELVGFEGATHGFFNYGRGDNKAYYETLRKMEEFLASLGYLRAR